MSSKLNFTELLSKRSSIRAFSNRPVPADIIDEILEDGLLSPSWSNTQPYRVAVASGKVRDQLADKLTANYTKVSKLQRLPKWRQLLHLLKDWNLINSDFKPIFKYPAELQKRRIETAKGLYKLLGIERYDYDKRDEQMARNFHFFDAPVALFVFVHKDLGVYSVLDAGIFLQSLMLSAVEKGLGTCAQGALALWRDPVEKYFAIPKDYKLICGVSLGYAEEDKVNAYKPQPRAVSEIKLKPKGTE